MAAWSVRIDADGATYDEATDSALRDRLAGHSPAIGAGHLRGALVEERISVQLSVEASTLHAAQERAYREVNRALSELFDAPRIVRMETLTEEDFAAEDGYLPELVGASEVAEMLGVTRQRVHQVVQDHRDFPAAQRTASGAVWEKEAVEQWARDWKPKRKPGRPPKNPAARAVAAGQ